MNIRSDLILITGDSKHQHGPPVGVRTYQFQVISGGSLAQVWLTVGPVNPWTHPMVIPTVPTCTVQYKYTHIDALIDPESPARGKGLKDRPTVGGILEGGAPSFLTVENLPQ